MKKKKLFIIFLNLQFHPLILILSDILLIFHLRYLYLPILVVKYRVWFSDMTTDSIYVQVLLPRFSYLCILSEPLFISGLVHRIFRKFFTRTKWMFKCLYSTCYLDHCEQLYPHIYTLNFTDIPRIETVDFLVQFTFLTISELSKFVMALFQCRLEPLTRPGQWLLTGVNWKNN
jgi:hypothetical protein